MNKKLVLMGAALLMTAATASAQKRVTGRVLDTNGAPIAGATVHVKGSQIKTKTDANGNFSLKNIPSNAKQITFSYFGMGTQTVSVSANMQVTLKDNEQTLGEAYVVAYGKATKASFTGAAAKIKGDVVENKATTEVTSALAGEVAGVQIMQSDGNPGANSGIVMRGIGSVNAAASPLIVVDGMPYAGDLSSIDPKDIESLDLMKDATATALYGSRGANGVIIISTKKGKAGKLSIGADVKYSVSGRWLPTYDVIKSPERFVELSWESLKNNFMKQGATEEQAIGAASAALFDDQNGGIPSIYNMWNADGADLIDPATGRFNSGITRKYNPDSWEDELFRTGQKVDAGVNLTGGTDRIKTYTSVGFTKDKGYLVGADYRRFTGRSNMDIQITNWLKGSTSLSYANSRQNKSVQNENASNNAMNFINSMPYLYPVFQRDANGNRIPDAYVGGYKYDYGMENGRPAYPNVNPAGSANLNINQTDADQFTGNGQLEASFLNDFKLTAGLGYMYLHSNNNVVTNPFYGDSEGTGFYENTSAISRQVVGNQILSWKHTYKDTHSFNAFVGHESTWTDNQIAYGSKKNLVRANGLTFGNAVVYRDLTGYNYGYSLDSWFGQLSYDYAEKYFINGALRADGSSRFAKGNRWGTFGSVGAAWNVTKEDFMRDLTWLRNLKLKASWGVTGNQSLNDDSDLGLGISAYYPYTDMYTIRNVNDEASFVFNRKGNKDLTWEKTQNVNVGVEFDIAGIVEGEVDYFNRLTSDMLFLRSTALSQGYASIPVNDGKMRNAGVEFSLTAHAVKTKDVSLDIRLNGSHYKNSIVELPMDGESGNRMDFYQYTSRFTWVKGGSIYDFYIPTYKGVDPETGYALYKTLNAVDAAGNVLQENVTDVELYKKNHKGEQYSLVEGTPTSDWTKAASDFVGKSATPKLTGGFGFDLRVKDFSLSTTFTYSLGGYAYDYVYARLMGDGELGTYNWHKDMENRWSKAGDVTDVPALTNGTKFGKYANARSTRFLTKRNYLQLSNIRLAYNFPESLTSRLGGMHGAQIYATGENLFLLSARKGFMPGTTSDGMTSDTQYLPSSSFTVGLKFNF